MKREILDGKTFGEWTVLRYAGDGKQYCQCSCGNFAYVSTYSLTHGKSKNCGDKVKHPRSGEKQFKDLTGKRFGELTAVKYVGDTRWDCICDKGHLVNRSWKNLSQSSTCPECKNLATLEQQSLREEQRISPTKRIPMIKLQVNDLMVISKVDGEEDRYLCKCKCGYTREIRGYNLRHPPSPTSYICRHKDIIGKRFGKLVVVDRLDGGWCKCKCDCTKTKLVIIGNLLNGTTNSCGCSKAATYTKEEVVNKINEFTQRTGERPFSKELADILDLGMTAIYEYIDNYNLKPLLNTKFGSKAEKEIYLMLSNRFKCKLHNRKILNGNELDIYIPEIKTAIEYNGVYWHRYPFKEKNYHQKKTLECIRNGIRLIHIFEYEWENEAIKPKIVSLLNGLAGTNKQLYARQLQVVEIDGKSAYEFEDANHLQNRGNSAINIGLADEHNEVYGVMTFGAPRFDNHYQYELIRLCYKLGYNIIGGSEKMFKYFLDKYDPSSILTYCSLAKFTGNVYSRLGFQMVKQNMLTKPNYVWVDPKFNTLSRYKTMKKDLIANGMGEEEQTEDEIMTGLGYSKVYDSGNLRYEYIKSI